MYQMMPLKWSILFLFFLFLYIIMLTTMHYIKSMKKTYKKKIQQKKWNWKW